MKKALIAYFSQGGTTAKIAAQIGQGIKDKNYEVDLYNIQDGTPPDTNQYEILGIGLPVYIVRPPFNVMEYVNALPNLNGMPFFVFLLYGSFKGTAGNVVRRTLTKKGGTEVGYTCYMGEDHFIGYLKRGYLLSPGRPTEKEINDAYTFGQDVILHATGTEYKEPPYDPQPDFILNIERLISIRPLVNQFYTHFFMVSKKKCNSCEICIKKCPMGNITLDKKGFPKWGRNCIACWYCEMSCPSEAITSALDWPIMSPFMKHNIKKSLADPLTDIAKVTFSKGKIKHI
jgi:flavodoxin/Pyruvate/2-oxoacid:ferredoxin oxidoreductase delta subunit